MMEFELNGVKYYVDFESFQKRVEFMEKKAEECLREWPKTIPWLNDIESGEG